MEDSRLTGAKQAVQNMLYYYLVTLRDIGTDDPKQVIATDIGEMVGLSQEQVDYVYASIADGSRITDNLSQCIKLLNGMLKAGRLDVDAVNIVVQILDIIKGNIETITKSLPEEEVNEQGQEKAPGSNEDNAE